jgi:hypothetical protein
LTYNERRERLKALGTYDSSLERPFVAMMNQYKDSFWMSLLSGPVVDKLAGEFRKAQQADVVKEESNDDVWSSSLAFEEERLPSEECTSKTSGGRPAPSAEVVKRSLSFLES